MDDNYIRSHSAQVFLLLSFSATADNFALLTMAVELQDYEPTPLSDRAPLRDTGYQPQAPAVEPVEWVKMQRNKLNSALAFDKKFGRQLPVWWPYNADGTCIFYAYRIFYVYLLRVSALTFHGVDQAISHLVQKEKPVNCLEHIDKSPLPRAHRQKLRRQIREAAVPFGIVGIVERRYFRACEMQS